MGNKCKEGLEFSAQESNTIIKALNPKSELLELVFKRKYIVPDYVSWKALKTMTNLTAVSLLSIQYLDTAVRETRTSGLCVSVEKKKCIQCAGHINLKEMNKTNDKESHTLGKHTCNTYISQRNGNQNLRITNV